ncbi:hypothetical protein Tco_1346769 [Tanacetum coccineum]
MHNNIMATGSRDRPPMLATGRYAQWQSRFMRYVDTKPNNDALRKCILQGPYKLPTVIIPSQPAIDDTPAIEEQTVLETFSNITPENKAHYDAEKEAIHLILTGIGDDIYLTVDACKTTHEMWIAIKKLQQGESLNKQDVKTSLFWEFGRFTSKDGESIESYYSIFYKMMNEMVRNQLEVGTMQVNVQFLQQLQPEWNANPLALVPAIQQYLDTHKGKEIAKPITPPSESASEEDSDPEQAQRDKDMQKNLTLIAKYFKKIYKPTNNNLRTSSNTRNKNVDTSSRYKNDNQTGQFRNQRTVTVAGAKETVGSQMLMCKQTEKGVPLQAEEADWLKDTDEEVDEQELEAHYMYITKIQEVHTTDTGPSFDAEPLEEVDSNVIPDSSDMCDNDNQADQNVE